VDNDQRLQLEENDASLTCANFAAHVCEIDLGILLCPATCGYCSPFTYEHLKRFEKPQVTMLPVMVFQTRFQEVECHGFAEIYEHQPYNPTLNLLPALDGRRNARVLTCIDRTKPYDEHYAMVLDCPPDGPVTHCHDNKTYITEKHTYHGDTIYPKILIEPHRDIMAMQAIDWLDMQTETLSLSTMVYTEGVELFSSVTVEFKVDEAGNIDGGYSIISYRDLINEPRLVFIICMILTCVGAFIGAALSIYGMVRHPEDCNWGLALYELLSRCVLFVYPVVLLVSWSQQTPMAVEYDHLLHAFLDLPSIEHEDVEQGVQAYFDAKTHLYSETTWLMRHRVTAYLVCYMQFLQLVFYFNNHPKMAVMTATMSKAASGIVHFAMLFSILFFMLGFMAHWMLGEHVEEFGTYGDTIKSQVRMVFGEFIMARGAEDLHGAMLIMYWVYAATFVMVVTMILLNFFLAIIVDAFVAVKDDNSENVVVGGFISDLFRVVRLRLTGMRQGWPSRRAVVEYLEDYIEQHKLHETGNVPQWIQDLDGPNKEEQANRTKITVTHTELMCAFPEQFDTKTVTSYLYHYYRISSTILCRRKESAGRDHHGGPEHHAGPQQHHHDAEAHPQHPDRHPDRHPQHHHHHAGAAAGSNDAAPAKVALASV